MDAVVPLSGWMLDQISWLDEKCPGFAGHYLRASPERRHHVAAYLSTTEVTDKGRDDVASFLASANHRNILQAAFADVPSGLRRALGKSGTSPHGKLYYQRLYDMLASGGDRIAEAIRHSISLSPERLTIIQSLSGKLCDSRIANRITTETEAIDLSLVADLLARRGIHPSAFVDALCRSSLPVSATVQRWSLRVPFPAGPIAACAAYQPVRDGIELQRLARKYRNCMRTYLPNLTFGDHAFAEYRWGDQDVLISFDRASGYWIVDSVHGYRNRAVHNQIASEAYAFAAAHGVPHRRIRSRNDKTLEALRRMSRR